jgi:chemotaxis-related protein WspD
MNPDARTLPGEWRDEWSRELAAPLVKSDSSDFRTLIVFRLGAEWFSLTAASVVEVSADTIIHRIPHRPADIGVVNVRGRVVPCIGLTALLHPIERPGATGTERLLVFRHDGWMFATRVDAVDGVHRVEVRGLQPPPPPGNASHFTASLWTLDRRSIAKLDEQRLFAAAKEALS